MSKELNENAKQWVAALRSGEYKQGDEYLLLNGKHCCLGVACELAIKAGVNIKKVDLNGPVFFGDQALVAPIEVLDWLGLRDENGDFFRPDGSLKSLTGLNDSGTPFAEIADIIESQPEGLFRESD